MVSSNFIIKMATIYRRPLKFSYRGGGGEQGQKDPYKEKNVEKRPPAGEKVAYNNNNNICLKSNIKTSSMKPPYNKKEFFSRFSRWASFFLPPSRSHCWCPYATIHIFSWSSVVVTCELLLNPCNSVFSVSLDILLIY